MILTGKAKEDFSYSYNMSNFNEYSEVLKNALIIEWLSTKRHSNSNLWNYCFSNAYWNRGMREYMESVKQAIVHANLIYNEKLKGAD